MDQQGLSRNLVFNDKEINFFARQLILQDFGEYKQNILFKSHITFIGLGGINSPAIIYLLSIGIKNITLVDYDIVQTSNLNRQIIFSHKDIGKKKITVAKKYLRKIFKDAKIKSYNTKIDKKNCGRIINKTDVVIDGSDNWKTMLAVNDHCVKNNIPLLSASVAGFDGNLVFFENIKEKHLCLRCVFPNKNDIDLPRCETIGILGTTAGIIGLLSAHKIVNFLTTKKNKKKISTITYFDGNKLDFTNININSNKNCKLVKK